MRLRPVQAATLCEWHDNHGFFGQKGVGKGKTLDSALAATVAAEVLTGPPRAILFVPAKLRKKTVRDFERLSKHWRMLPIRLESYQLLSRADLKTGKPKVDLDAFQPNIIILDECHWTKNPRASCTKKLRRYIKERRKAGLPLWVMALSGTIAKRSLRDFQHIIEWCLGAGAPLPRDEVELTLWSDATDEKPRAPDPVDPGVLLSLRNDDERRLAQAEGVRRAVGRRIFETPGALRTKQGFVDCSLVVEVHELVPPKVVEDAFRHMKTSWTTLDGWPISDGLSMYRHCRELSAGFYGKWSPRPPLDWLYPRSDWCSAVRETLANNRRGLDSEFQVAHEVALAIARGQRHELADTYCEWKAVEKTFTPNPMPVWIDDFALDWAVEWAAREKGLIWVEHIPVGRRLAEKTGLPYYGAGGMAGRKYIEDHTPGTAAIASIASNGEGRNLQAIWSRALYVTFPTTGTGAEQGIGRLHRDGQLADEVEIDVMVSCRESYAGFVQAMRDAQYHADLFDSDMKMDNRPRPFVDKEDGTRYCDVVVPEFKSSGYAWKEPQRKKATA